MKKALYIDPISAKGHLSFNKTYVDKLLKIKGVKTDFVFRENYFKMLGRTEISLKLEIPDLYYKNNRSGLVNRYFFLKCLLFIKSKIDFTVYDYIIFGNYEEISFFLSGIKNRCYLINHHNLQGLDNSIKKLFYKLISKTNYQVVFQNSFSDFLKSIGIENIIVSPHGLPKPFQINKNLISNEINSFLRDYKNFEYLIFLPSSSSSDKSFIDQLLTDDSFLSFLKEKKIFLLIKGQFNLKNKADNILITQNYFSENLYRYIFLEANFILIPYPHSFKNRVSNILFESIANNKVCLLSSQSELINYKEFINYEPYFKDIGELVQRLKENLQLSKDKSFDKYIYKERFNVNLNFIK